MNAQPAQEFSAMPDTVPALLRNLRMDTAPVETQKAALRGWLRTHPPSASLRLSLLSNGYGPLLGHRLR